MSLGSTAAKNWALNACYGSDHSSTWPDNLYIHLFTSNPLVGGRELVIGVGGYAAIEMANTNTNWNAASGGQKTNGATQTFPTSTGAWSSVATYFWLTDSATALTAPTYPTVTAEGTTGSVNWQYVLTALNTRGETQASGIGATGTGVVTLSVDNYNRVTWSAVSGATTYNLYRREGSSGTFKLIASGLTGTSHDDTGTAVSTTTPPVSNTTSNLLDGGPLALTISVTGAGYIISFAPDTIVITAT